MLGIKATRCVPLIVPCSVPNVRLCSECNIFLLSFPKFRFSHIMNLMCTRLPKTI